jgi:hypothetical protein
LQVNDPTAGGSAGDNATFVVVEGSVAGSPVPPAVPDTAIPLAQVLRTATDTSITDAMITDRRVASVLAVPADVASLGDIGDVDLAGLSDGDIIRYDSASGEWLPEAPVAPIQTVQATTSTQLFISTSTLTDTGLSASITPTSATSKILVLFTQMIRGESLGDAFYGNFKLLRGSTVILAPGTTAGNAFGINSAGASSTFANLIISGAYIDSPATTSSVTYKTQSALNFGSSGSVIVQFAGATSYMQLIEIPG